MPELRKTIADRAGAGIGNESLFDLFNAGLNGAFSVSLRSAGQR